jgi:O-antigen/teichoic acid export membrane protein
MIKKIIQVVKPKSEFSSNVLIVMFGTILSQVLPIIASPVITRLYGTSQFGVFATYSAIVGILSSISSLRFELAINLPKSDSQSYIISIFSLIFNLIFSLLVFFVLLIFDDILLKALKIESSSFVHLIPISIIIIGTYRTINFIKNRDKSFKDISKSKIIQSTGTIVTQLSFSNILNSFGLIFGTIIGQLVSTIYLITSFDLKSYLKNINRLNSRAIIAVFIRYKKFALYQTPSTLVESVSAQLPIFLLGYFYSPIIVGLFALSQRFIRMPIMIIAGSFGEVMRQKASEDFGSKGNARDTFVKVFKKLLFISSIPFIILFIFSPTIFSFVFGQEWYEAGVYARILTPIFWMSFVVSPVSVMIIIAEKQDLDLIIQIFLILFSALSLSIGYYVYNSPKVSLTLFTIVYCVKYCIEFYFSYKYSKK